MKLLGKPGLHVHREHCVASAGPATPIMRVARSEGLAGMHIRILRLWPGLACARELGNTHSGTVGSKPFWEQALQVARAPLHLAGLTPCHLT